MQVVGFNFTKIKAERNQKFKPSSMNTNIEFINLEKEKLEALKDSDVIKTSFLFGVNYGDEKKKEKDALVSFEGHLLLSVNKEESKELLKSWKKKQLPDSYKLPLINLVLRRCSTKAIQIEEDLNLPFHIPIPKVRSQQ
jgi:hypothetical protein